MAQRKPFKGSVATTTETADKKESTKAQQQASRKGKITIITYTEPQVRKQLKMMALENDTTQTELIKEGLNLLFAKYDKPIIA